LSPDEQEPSQNRVNQLVAIAAGGALGALLRFWVAGGVAAWLGRDFPYGTLIINVSGSLAMGVLYVLLLERFDVSPLWRGSLLVGLLGAFTTFSTFSIETVNLIEAGEGMKALANVLFSVILCIGATAAGLVIGRQL
jgi:CrcB protein